MIKFTVLTLFPEQVESAFLHSIMKRAVEDGKIALECIDIRAYTKDPHGHVDDAPFGGGAGMLMQAEPIVRAFNSVREKNIPDRVIYCSPRGRVFHQNIAEELSRESHILFLCGHYEGVDQRALECLHAEEFSLGDYVISGGELAAVIMMDAISRIKEGVLNKKESYEEESFSEGLLEYPQYTRPRIFLGKEVPEILLSGDHQKIKEWRHKESLNLTETVRPELFQVYKEQHPEEFYPKKKKGKNKGKI
ncbi:MAG: tRNA (guanosine(37)-N1)-methyltransferase TrmD [Lachnospiraceae bacterium]|nr:tRNA (guanosine(37)-N1)-methyltransferase TrmD [Lachnospiraceae bacterium]